jgi:glycosyltransferase involved in cell wall biosynthesis
VSSADSATLTFVIHEASITGAPLLGLSIAHALTEKFGVNLVFRTGGLLLRHLDKSCFRSITVIHDQSGDESARLAESMAAAADIMRRQQPDYLYVNSLSVSEWLLARPPTVRRAALHTHEAEHEINSLIIGHLFRPTSVRRADILIGASMETLGLIRSLLPHRSFAEIEFGIAVDVPNLRTLALETRSLAHNSKGAPVVKERPLVLMCGTASYRKGADIFADVAAELPDADFLWIGPWAANEGASQRDWVGTAHEMLKYGKQGPDNLYFTGPIMNPYPWFREADLFFLSSREDPNPIVAIEALVLETMVVAFRQSGQAGLRCMSHGLAISGRPAVESAKPVISALLSHRTTASPSNIDLKAFDMREKIAEVIRAFTA